MSVPTDLDRRFRDAADREGLVDVAYDVADSPVGDLLVAVTERGLCRIAFRPDEAIDEIAADFGARALRIPRRVDSIRRELDEYFDGKRREFDLETDLSPVAPFQRQALRELARIPFGQVITYGALGLIVNPAAESSTSFFFTRWKVHGGLPASGAESTMRPDVASVTTNLAPRVLPRSEVSNEKVRTRPARLKSSAPASVSLKCRPFQWRMLKRML